ncbi:hypothetical protein [Roseomonas xinghualingensis]|uniref:hypothetical protein n=1 Tax=Roseomonas xinghualingensis TaxID=2986475 RepID=UPI0021F223A6|nr:hypothetical protein [Roseomonas sp. SXEYE001]MCV4209770.1 hypothetical protein [Roseomonas sp. SXEYE001]
MEDVPQVRDAPERGGSGGEVDQGLHDFGAPLVIENETAILDEEAAIRSITDQRHHRTALTAAKSGRTRRERHFLVA